MPESHRDRSPGQELPVWPDKIVVPSPGKIPTKPHPAMLVACVLLVISPLAGIIALVTADGWSIPVWLGGWILAVVAFAVASSRGTP
jgi:hypothetical protein